MEVVWSGSMERASVEAERVYVTSDERPRIDSKAIVRAALHQMGEATLLAICEATGLSSDTVNSVLYRLRTNGELDSCEHWSVERSPYGRSLRLYRLRTEA